MSDNEPKPDEANLTEVNSSLNEGIQCCRAVLVNYRSLISGTGLQPSSNDNETVEASD